MGARTVAETELKSAFKATALVLFQHAESPAKGMCSGGGHLSPEIILVGLSLLNLHQVVTESCLFFSPPSH